MFFFFFNFVLNKELFFDHKNKNLLISALKCVWKNTIQEEFFFWSERRKFNLKIFFSKRII